MKKILALVATASLMFSCSQEVTPDLEKLPINISVGQQTRANDSTYDSGDEVGIYVVNYDGSTAGSLKATGNQVDNMRFTYRNSAWAPDETIYWKDKTTAADFYAYYPYSASANISAHPFAVAADQSAEEDFWASDFLWGKTDNVSPTSSAVPIVTNHSLSRILVDVVPGNGFAGAWGDATVSVKICDVKTSATIDLATGVATATGENGEIVPLAAAETGTTLSYKAMMIPQVAADNSKLVVVTVDGVDYIYRKGYEFKVNTEHKFTVTVNKTGGSVDMSIGEWTIDDTTNEGDAEEESESEAIIPNNQIWYTATAKVEPDITYGFGANIESNEWDETTGEGVIVFDGEITKIGYNAFNQKTELTGITIPSGVSWIYDSAFFGCTNLNKVNIPSIEAWCNIYFEPSDIVNWPYSNPLYYAKNLYLNGELVTDLMIPDGVKKIPNYAFHGCNSINSVTIGKDIEYIGSRAFSECENLKSVIIPNTDHNVDLANNVFALSSNLVSVALGNSITSIPFGTFDECSSLESITIPETVTEIEKLAFDGCTSLLAIFCRPLTPPAIYYGNSSSSFPLNTEMNIYVPRGSYDDYMRYTTANNSIGYVDVANWYAYESHIQPYDFD